MSAPPHSKGRSVTITVKTAAVFLGVVVVWAIVHATPKVKRRLRSLGAGAGSYQSIKFAWLPEPFGAAK